MVGGTALKPKVVAHPKEARLACGRQIRRARQAPQGAAMPELSTLAAVQIKHRRVISSRNAISGTDFPRGRSIFHGVPKQQLFMAIIPWFCSSTPRRRWPHTSSLANCSRAIPKTKESAAQHPPFPLGRIVYPDNFCLSFNLHPCRGPDESRSS